MAITLRMVKQDETERILLKDAQKMLRKAIEHNPQISGFHQAYGNLMTMQACLQASYDRKDKASFVDAESAF